MSVPAGVIHAVFRGALEGGEQFAWGFWVKPDGDATQSATDNAMGAIKAAFDANLKAFATAVLSAAASYTDLAVYGYTGGRNAAFQNDVALGYPGTAATAVLPLQTAMVVSHRTGRPGRSYRGRSYLPVTSRTITAHQFATADCDTAAGAFKGLFDALLANNGTGGFQHLTPVIASSTLAVATPITSIVVDSKPDVQRRRAASAPALYTKVAAL